MYQSRVPIILASSSPRRHALLNQVKIPHTQISVATDESPLPQEMSTDYIQRMVAQKAKATIPLVLIPAECLLITADTIGVLADNSILVKPTDFTDACDMWQKMSDPLNHRRHHVWTAVQVSHLKGKQILLKKTALVKTEVEFIALTSDMMATYWQSGEPHDKAGGYAIQGLGASWVKAIYGSYSNVVGLPIVETLALLKEGSR